MCGIAGLLQIDGDRPVDVLRDEATRMATTMAHRGPDDAGAWASSDGRVALSQRRLSIVDLSPLGHNPMPWDGGRLWITFNGEIYNFHELRLSSRRQATAFDRRPTPRSFWRRTIGGDSRPSIDSPACSRSRCGMVRAAGSGSPATVWERSRCTTPSNGGTLRFASELKAFVADDRFPREVDSSAGSLVSPLRLRALRRTPFTRRRRSCRRGTT